VHRGECEQDLQHLLPGLDQEVSPARGREIGQDEQGQLEDLRDDGGSSPAGDSPGDSAARGGARNRRSALELCGDRREGQPGGAPLDKTAQVSLHLDGKNAVVNKLAHRPGRGI
jgi:hypothetical protein